MARITYKQYPLSEELTNKSYNVASWTRPLFGFGLGTVLSFALSMVLNVSSNVFTVLMVIGMVGGPIGLQIIRAKKFAKYDAEYAKILKEQGTKNTEKDSSAANHIESGYKNPVTDRSTGQKAQASQSKPQPVQKPTVQQQPTYQQPAYQPPVQQTTYQPPVVQSTSYQPPVYQLPMVHKTLDEQIDEICKEANANLDGANDPSIHWQCVQKLEDLFRDHPESERVQRNLAQNLANYAWYANLQSFSDCQRGYSAIYRALTLQAPDPGAEELERRKTSLIFYAVHGAIFASNMRDICAMEEALQWLHTASAYRLENSSGERLQYINVALPSAYFLLGYWLGKAYLEQNPPQKQKAKMVLWEALQTCPFAMIRTCDVNPKCNTDLTPVVYRDSVQALYNQTL